MSTYSQNFENETIGQPPSSFEVRTGAWEVYDDSGRVLKCSSLISSLIKFKAIEYNDNFVLKFRIKFISSASSQWRVIIRSDLTQVDRIDIGCLSGVDDTISIYERISDVSVQRANASYTYGTGWHDVTVVAQDGSIFVRVGSTEIHYDSMTILSGIRLDFFSFNNNLEIDDIKFISYDKTLNIIRNDSFNNSNIENEWALIEALPGLSWVETSELKFSGTATLSAYNSLRTSFTSDRRGFYTEIKIRFDTAMNTGEYMKRILLSVSPVNYFQIVVNAFGYTFSGEIDSVATSNTTTSPIGDETSTFNIIKIIWDEDGKHAYGWINNIYLGSLNYSSATLSPSGLSRMQYCIYAQNLASTAVDRRYKDFVFKVESIIQKYSPMLSNRTEYSE